MTNEERVAPQYQGMVGTQGERRQPAENPHSATEQVLSQMSEGEAWSHEATRRDYRTGGNEPGDASSPLTE